MTFKEMQDKVLRYLDEAGDTDTTVALVKDALNEGNRTRASQEKWSFMLWDQPVTLAVLTGQQYYSLHSEFLRPYYFWNRDEQDWVTQITASVLPDAHTDWNNDTGPALRFSLRTRRAVQAQPSSASVLTVSSSNAADNTVRSVQVRGDTTEGVKTETILCGASSVAEFTSIIKVTKIGTWVGTLTLAAGATTLLQLFSSETQRSYQQLFLPRIPDGNQTIEYQFYRQPVTMTLDEDLPDIPPPFEDLLVYDALLYFASYNQYDGTTVKLWMERQQRLERGLQLAYSEDQALEAQASYTAYIPR